MGRVVPIVRSQWKSTEVDQFGEALTQTLKSWVLLQAAPIDIRLTTDGIHHNANDDIDLCHTYQVLIESNIKNNIYFIF